jgi:ATP-dependent RNA helicase SUPV3L1/SUV3
VEDKLSDALHERLTERFVDRRTSTLMRRLRENAMLEPQINKTGEVVVEGHVIGQLDGFVFLPDASSGGSEAKALHNAAQKALAGEIAARSTRLGEAADEQLVLTADGTIRWTGAAVGKLFAGEEPVRPRVRLLADEHLTGAPRDAVQARLDQWIKSHVEKLLGPLFELSSTSDIIGIARGVAFQLVEALGVLDRQKVADEVKGLQQPERASLRKYGVRFGAYHIYVPALLKPAPRSLAAQLWALAHKGPESKGLDDLLHLAGSGRTSIPVNREIDATLYRCAGYRVCGERAVRVDILERLADHIRPALAWREGTPGQKPAAAFPGGGFTVVNGMTSLIGAAGEDFASILRSLGYRMERRPKPVAAPEPVPAAPTPDSSAQAAEEIAAADASAPLDNAAPDNSAPDNAPPTEAAPVAAEPASAEEQSQDKASSQEPAASETHEAVAVAAEIEPATVSSESTAVSTETAATPAESASQLDVSVAATPENTVASEQPAAEPDSIEVWRPGRSEGRRRPRDRRREPRRHTGMETQKPAEAAGETAVAVSTESRPSSEQAATSPPPKSGRPPRHRRHGGEHRQDNRQESRQDRGERPQRERERERPQARPARFERREREKAPDPNSPFAKLAALKAQLEAEAKERR